MSARAPELFDVHAELVDRILREHRVVTEPASRTQSRHTCCCGWTVLDARAVWTHPTWDDWARRHVIEIALAMGGPLVVPVSPERL